MNSSLKIITAVFWLCFAYNTFLPFPEPSSSIIAWCGIILALVHVIEFVLKKSALDEIGAGGTHGFYQTLLFGFLYWLPLLKKKQQ